MTEVIPLDHRVIRRRARYERLRTVFFVAVAFSIVAFAFGMAFLGLQIQATQNAIEGCTVPGRPCYEATQERIVEAIERIEANQAEVSDRGSIPSRSNLELTIANSENLHAICVALKLECVPLPITDIQEDTP